MDENQDIDSDNQNINPDILEQLKNFDSLELDKIKALYGQDIDHSAYETPDKKTEKLLKCPHEIMFTITAKVMAENLKGEITGDKEICIKHYHIPVPIDKDYKDYMITFFNYLQDNILAGIDKANETSKEKEE